MNKVFFKILFCFVAFMLVFLSGSVSMAEERPMPDMDKSDNHKEHHKKMHCKKVCVVWGTEEECKIVGPDSEAKTCVLRPVCKKYDTICQEGPIL
ncbi:hypothetical protein [Thermodesulfobacterium hveragerdense]|uniref:hypothetical protein n=1 Tax=Thermodesulfobacterium hveragerdense TaxID=53424 RepID=UPI000429FBE9|nr:hypothetical protein [Thermodesulfobacterium hveragerdense]